MKDIVESEILKRAPTLAPERVAALSALWDDQLDRILRRVFELTADSGRVAWPESARAEAVGELARLILWLGTRVVDRLAAERDLDSVDPHHEAEALRSPHAIARIEETAQTVATHIWFRVYDDLHARRGSVDRSNAFEWPPTLPGRVRRPASERTKRNHYVPEFTSLPWADAKGKARVVRRDERRVVTSRVRSVASFGYEKRLYPQHLEDWFSLIENRAKSSYDKLVTVDVLTPEDRYFWIAFLVTQFLRTPTYFSSASKRLRRMAQEKQWPWQMTPELLRRSHETLFRQDKVFAEYYERLNRARWSVLVTAEESPFPRTDTPVLISATGGWRLLYPLTPTKCFVAGPQERQDGDVPAALSEHVNPERYELLTRAFLASSRRSFLIRGGDDREAWSKRAREHIPMDDPAAGCIAWGELYTL